MEYKALERRVSVDGGGTGASFRFGRTLGGSAGGADGFRISLNFVIENRS